MVTNVTNFRKECEWRTLLVVPELDHEVNRNNVNHFKTSICSKYHKLMQMCKYIINFYLNHQIKMFILYQKPVLNIVFIDFWHYIVFKQFYSKFDAALSSIKILNLVNLCVEGGGDLTTLISCFG